MVIDYYSSVASKSRSLSLVLAGAYTSCLTPALVRECTAVRIFSARVSEVNMAEVSERTLQVAVVLSFAAGFVAGWQANRMRRKFLDWRKKRLQDKLSETQKKIDLS